MTGPEILNNSFFAFWHILGEHFIVLVSFVLAIGIVLSLVSVLTKK